VQTEADVLNKLPKTQPAAAKKKLHEIWMAATPKEASDAFDQFIDAYKRKYSLPRFHTPRVPTRPVSRHRFP
jgi:hypothetical protein